MWKVGEFTLSGSSTVLDNIFTSDYLNYRLVISNVTSSANENIGFRMRVSGTDASGSDYYQGANRVSFAGATSGTGAAPDTYGYLGYFGIYVGGITCDFLQPNQTKATVVTYQSLGADIVWSGACQHAVNTAYTGIRILSASGKTITGDVKVYGYR